MGRADHRNFLQHFGTKERSQSLQQLPRNTGMGHSNAISGERRPARRNVPIQERHAAVSVPANATGVSRAPRWRERAWQDPRERQGCHPGVSVPAKALREGQEPHAGSAPRGHSLARGCSPSRDGSKRLHAWLAPAMNDRRDAALHPNDMDFPKLTRNLCLAPCSRAVGSAPEEPRGFPRAK